MLIHSPSFSEAQESRDSQHDYKFKDNWMKILCVSNCLNSQTTDIPKCCFCSLEMLCRAFTGAAFNCCLFPGLSVLSKRKACSVGPLKTISFLWLRKGLGCFHSMFWVIITLYLEAAFGWVWADGRSWYILHLRIHPAASISNHIINIHQWPSSTGSLTWPCHNIASTKFDDDVVALDRQPFLSFTMLFPSHHSGTS